MPILDTKVTIIIPNWNGASWLMRCLKALENQSFKQYSITVVDNASSDDSVKWLKTSKPHVQTIQLDQNYGFAYAVNTGIKAAKTPFIVLLNNDTEPEENWLYELIHALENASSDVLSASSCMLSLDNHEVIDDAGDFINWAGDARKRGHGRLASEYQEKCLVMSACAGAACYKREFFEKVGLFDENFVTYLEDVDIGLRAQLQGYKCVYVPTARILHKGHGSSIARPLYVEFITANRLSIFFKSIPARLLLLYSMRLIRGQANFFIAYNNWEASFRGYKRFFLLLPKLIRSRRKNVAKIAISHDEIEKLLTWPSDIGIF